MRLIDADKLQYRRQDYGGYDDVGDEDRKIGILYLLKEDIENAPTISIDDIRLYKDELNVLAHGKWIKLYDNNYQCSACKGWVEFSGGDTPDNLQFCPCCGAFMS